MSIEEIKDALYYMARSREDADVLRAALDLIRTHPEAQPNEPLTLEELMQMDGQPVWLKIAGGVWGLVAADAGVVWLDWGMSIELSKLVGLAYRRPPKEEV